MTNIELLIELDIADRIRGLVTGDPFTTDGDDIINSMSTRMVANHYIVSVIGVGKPIDHLWSLYESLVKLLPRDGYEVRDTLAELNILLVIKAHLSRRHLSVSTGTAIELMDINDIMNAYTAVKYGVPLWVKIKSIISNQ